MYSTKIIKIDMGIVEGGLTFMHRGLGMRYIIKLNVPLSSLIPRPLTVFQWPGDEATLESSFTDC